MSCGTLLWEYNHRQRVLREGAARDRGYFLSLFQACAGYAAQKNEELVKATGLHVVSACEEVIREEGEAVTFLWVVAKKPT
jgi:hypothetical protein